MTRPLAKTKIQAQVKTMTRTALLLSTTNAVMQCFRTYDPNGAGWLLDRLDAIVEHQLVNEFELVASLNGKPLTSARFRINWDEHQVLQKISNKVDASGIEDGDTFVSTQQVVGAVQNYLDQVKSAHPSVTFKMWYFHNPKVKHDLGEERFFQLLRKVPNPEQDEINRNEYREIHRWSLTRKIRRIFLPDAEETDISIK